MYKFYKLIFFCLFIFYQSNVYSSERKIVYLNLDEIIQKSIPGKLILQKLHEQNKMNLEKFKSKRSNLINQEKDIIKKKNILSKEEFEANVSDLNKKMKNFNKEREQTFLKFEEEKKKKLNNFLSKITTLVETFVKENSLNIVLNKKNLFIASKNFDITNQIIEIVNKNIK